jgi:hypothetical protein
LQINPDKERNDMTNIKHGLLLFLTAFLAISCATYEDRVAPIRLPETSPSMVVVDGLKVSATAHVNITEAMNIYGFDIRNAGILPVQLTFQNDGTRSVEIDPEQTFLVDDHGNAWPILTLRKTYERTNKYVDIGETFKGAAKPSFMMGAAGAVAGLAMGIVSGDNIAESMSRGAVIGAAGGAIVGGSEAAARSGRSIREDLADKSMRNSSIHPGQIAYGTLFFPGTMGSEAETARQLRLSIYFDDGSGKVVPIYFGN